MKRAGDLAIPIADPSAAYRARREEIDGAVAKVLSRGRYILGEEVEAFESEFASYLGAGFAVGVGSGTDALQLALRACGIGPGDTVVTVSHTAVATVAAIELAGAAPVLVDIEPDSMTIDPAGVEQALAELRHPPKALVAVHLYGHPCDMAALMPLARKHGLVVVEDCAQAAGATLDGKKAGTLGDCAAFSFYPTKNLGAFGDGGAVVTGDAEKAANLSSLRQYGWDAGRISRSPGLNSRLDELQAAILRVGLRSLDTDNARRRHLADVYTQGLAGSETSVPPAAPGVEHAFHQFVVRSGRRDALAAYLEERGVGTAVHYRVPVHRQPTYAGRLEQVGSLPNTDNAAAEVLSLPIYPQLTVDQIEWVTEAVCECPR